MLPPQIIDEIKGAAADTAEAEYIVSADPCGDDWILVTSIPTQYILDAKVQAQNHIIRIAIIATLIAIAAGGVYALNKLRKYKIASEDDNVLVLKK